MPLRRPLAIIAAFAALLSASALHAQNKTLTIGVSQFAATLHPSIESAVAKSVVLDMARRPLTTFDADWELICMLCTELPTIENGKAVLEQTPEGKDGIAVTFTMQPGATWGDGMPITTEDVTFTWEVGRHPQSAFSNIELYRQIYKIDVIDEKTFTVHHDKVQFQYNELNDLRILPAHLERPIFEAAPAEYATRTTYNADPTNPGLYFGPYKVIDVESGAFTVLEPNDTWYGEKPYFERIVIRTIENTAAMEANLLSGGIDMISGELGVTIDQALAFAQRHGDDYTMIFKPGLLYEHIDLNLDNPRLRDRRVRQALLYALDRKALVEQLFEGRQPVANTSTSALDWIYDEGVKTYPYDPERAIALLEAAGYTEIEDGVRQNAAGDRLSFEFMTTAGNRTRELVQQVLQSQWHDVGVEAVIRNEPARVYFGGTLSERKYTGMGMFAWSSSPENVPRTILHSDHIPTAENNWSGQNYTGFENAAMDTLIEAAEVELDPERRRELWRWMQAIYAEELPVLPLYFRANTYILPKWLDGVVPTGHQYGTSLWVEYWRRSDAS